MIRAWAFGALVLLLSSDLRADVAPVAAIRLEEEWSYRRFLDSEPSSTDKHYVASGFFVVNLRVDVYPFSEQAGALRDFGFVGSYGRAFGLKSLEIDTIPPSEVATTFYHFDTGLAYRIPSSSPLSLSFAAVYERWVFDFDEAQAPSREVPTARYSFARAGTDARFAIGSLALLGNAALLLPVSIASLGDRDPTGIGFGARAKLGVGLELFPMLAIDLGGTYTVVTFHLPSVPGRADAQGTVLDQYLAASLGLTLRL